MKNFKVGLQLYSVREEMKKDMDSTLKAVKEIGYDYVEFAGYFGKSAEEVRALLDKHGLTCISVHQSYDVFLDEPQKNVDFLKTIGAKYCAIPWMDIKNHKGHENFDKAMGEITQVAKLLKENGIQMLYHNHDFEFNKFEGKYCLDWLYETIPSDLLKPEIDTCWVSYAGENPCAYLEKYSGRVDVLHLKDYVCKNPSAGPVYDLIDDSGKELGSKDDKEESGFEFRPVGQGVQDFPSILSSAEKAGIDYVIVEQDQWPTATAIESVKQSRKYLRTLGL